MEGIVEGTQMGNAWIWVTMESDEKKEKHRDDYKHQQLHQEEEETMRQK